VLPDYYAILGVEPVAEAAVIYRAYRRQAAARHPDHGGSHEQMVLVNEAWGILSNPQTRARYDEARRQAASAQARQLAARDTETARQTSANYPRQWAEFEDWLNSLAADIAQAEYGTVHGHYGTTWPTAKNSRSGSLFIWGGGIIGFALGVAFFLIATKKWEMRMFHGTLLASIVLACCGAWIGSWLHRMIHSLVRPRQKTTAGKRRVGASPPVPIVIRCPSCTQQIRLPKVAQPLAVTCPQCRYKFDLPASRL
jgi:hypothetical protein